MLHEHALRSRDEVINHLIGELHNWLDGSTGGAYREWQMTDQYGRPWVPTSEYMAIHRELHLAAPVLIVPAEARI